MLFKKNLLLSIVSLALFSPLHSDIERLSVQWQQGACPQSCYPLMIKALTQVGGIAEIVLNQQQSQVDLRWKPRVPFSFDFIRNAIGVVGIPILEVHTQVRGTITQVHSGYILESLGDNTRFVLLGPAQQSLTKNVPQRNIESHLLTPELQQQLALAVRNFDVVVIKGPLLKPFGGLYLIIEQITFNRISPPH